MVGRARAWHDPRHLALATTSAQRCLGDHGSLSMPELVLRREWILSTLLWPSACMLGCAHPGSAPTPSDTPGETIRMRSVTLPDGRIAEVGLGGDPAGRALVMHHGTPGDATTFANWHAPCRARGLRLICMSRPGYAGSTRLAGRTVAQVPDDTV
ncbi:MAG TPA: hypothetical protein VFK10_17895, partial [Burkholderiaceae bacterium]|nr:hypothetical protein [Burkholderiaceae bacterium]